MTQEIISIEDAGKEVLAKAINVYLNWEQNKDDAWFKKEIDESLGSFFTEKVIALNRLDIEIPYNEFEKFHLSDKNFNFYFCLSKLCKTIPLMGASMSLYAEEGEEKSAWVLSIFSKM